MTDRLGFSSGEKVTAKKPKIIVGHCGRCGTDLQPKTIMDIGNGLYCPNCAADIYRYIT